MYSMSSSALWQCCSYFFNINFRIMRGLNLKQVFHKDKKILIGYLIFANNRKVGAITLYDGADWDFDGEISFKEKLGAAVLPTPDPLLILLTSALSDPDLMGGDGFENVRAAAQAHARQASRVLRNESLYGVFRTYLLSHWSSSMKAVGRSLGISSSIVLHVFAAGTKKPLQEFLRSATES